MDEGLGRSIVSLREINTISGLRVTNGGEKQTHQQFVDDTKLMGHPSVQEAGSFKQCLERFGRASSLEVNAQKSQIFFFNTPRVTRHNIYQIPGFQESSLSSKYMGTPLIKLHY